MTSGVTNEASGWARFRPGPWATVALIGLAVMLVNVSSAITEFRRAEVDTHWSAPLLWEATSFIALVGMAPLIGRAVSRWPMLGDNLVRDGFIHLALTIPYALAHVLAVWGMREAAYAAAGERYGFFDNGVLETYLYEWRKDVLVYGAIASTYWWFEHRAQRKPASSADDRIEIRDGATAVFLAPRDVFWVEAAGNYVEFHAAGRSHLVRGTLASWEAQLTTRGFVRVHRSRLVNRARISAIKPTPSGDVEITLDNGHAITGSRRYRDALESPTASV